MSDRDERACDAIMAEVERRGWLGYVGQRPGHDAGAAIQVTPDPPHRGYSAEAATMDGALALAFLMAAEGEGGRA